MNVRESMIGEIAIRDGATVTGIDVEGLLRRLLLFDSVIVRSFRLQEMQFLIRSLGIEGFRQLRKSGVLKINCEFLALTWPRTRNGKRVYPLCTFSFGKVDVVDREAILKEGLKSLQALPGLKNHDRELIENDILSNLLRPPQTYGDELLSQFEFDVRNQNPILRMAVSDVLRKEHKFQNSGLECKVEEIEHRVFRLINNMPKAVGISEEQADGVLNNALLAVGNANRRLADMRAYLALTGFSEEETPLLFEKLGGIVKALNPEVSEAQFSRVAAIANFPTVGHRKKLDVDKLLAVRESKELLEFREWVSKLGALTDAQIKDMVEGLRNKLGSLVQSGPGRALRLAAVTGIGFVSVPAGVAAGVLDTFLVEKLFPKSGIFAFLTEMYPSLFLKD